MFPSAQESMDIKKVSVPLRGVGCFAYRNCKYHTTRVSVPLRGVGCFEWLMGFPAGWRFPSPCGVWVVSEFVKAHEWGEAVSVPLRGVGCFYTAELRGHGQKGGSVPLRGVGCFGKAAHSFWCNRKKNCQLCYFIVSYWQMFINSKLRNCKVPCEAYKTAT